MTVVHRCFWKFHLTPAHCSATKCFYKSCLGCWLVRIQFDGICRLIQCSLSPKVMGIDSSHSSFLEYFFQNKHIKMKEEKKIIVSVTAMVKENLRQNIISVSCISIFTERSQCTHYCINSLFIINRNNITFSYSLLSWCYLIITSIMLFLKSSP